MKFQTIAASLVAHALAKSPAAPSHKLAEGFQEQVDMDAQGQAAHSGPPEEGNPCAANDGGICDYNGGQGNGRCFHSACWIYCTEDTLEVCPTGTGCHIGFFGNDVDGICAGRGGPL